MTRRTALGSMLLILVTGTGMVAFDSASAQARAERALRQALMAAAQGVLAGGALGGGSGECVSPVATCSKPMSCRFAAGQ